MEAGSSLQRTAAGSPARAVAGASLSSRRRRSSPLKRLRHLRLPQGAKLTTVLAEMRQHRNEQSKAASLLLEQYNQQRRLLLTREQTLALELESKGICVEDPNLDVYKTFRPNRKNRTCHVSAEPAPVMVVEKAATDARVMSKDSEREHRPRGESAAHCDTSSRSEVEGSDAALLRPATGMQEGMLSLPMPKLVVPELSNVPDILDADFALEESQHDASDVPYVPPEFAKVFGT